MHLIRAILTNKSKPAASFQALRWLLAPSFKETLTMVKLLSEQSIHPWTIVRILPEARHYTVACFRNRQDADDHLRVLRRFIPAAEFEIIFPAPDNDEQDNQA